MVSSGMKAAGYQYVNIDDCWWSAAATRPERCSRTDTKFPNGIKALADYVHGKGLKLGIYGDRGIRDLRRPAGCRGHETRTRRRSRRGASTT